jgi:hypothetical protein
MRSKQYKEIYSREDLSTVIIPRKIKTTKTKKRKKKSVVYSTIKIIDSIYI